MQPGLFFSERVINVWNSLPCDITNFSSVKAFKRSLRAIDLSGFCAGSFKYVFVCSYIMFVFFSRYFIL